MAEALQGWKRSDFCGKLTLADINREVTLMGWVQRRRDLGALMFIALRDYTGLVQVFISDDAPAAITEKAALLRNEYVVAVRGIVRERESANKNAKMDTGDIEIHATDIKLLAESSTPPIYVEDEDNASEMLRLKYRYLDLRKPSMQKVFRLRHQLTQIVRRHMDENGFTDIETPMLTRSTPEGARDYLVPSRVHSGAFYALPQSPQLFKQLLMVSGFDRYYQIARCFRDEDLRADRQPEFTQIDMELSFVETEDVMAYNEGLLARIFKELLGEEIPLPFPRMSFAEAMNRYGSDKPDTRFGIELHNLSELVKDSEFVVFRNALEKGGSVRAIAVPGGASFSRKEIDALVEFAKGCGAGGLAWAAWSAEWKSSFLKFTTPDVLEAMCQSAGAKPGDLTLFMADKDELVCNVLGALRLEVARKLDIIPTTNHLLWITEFPLLEYSEDEGRYVARHHPFTAPMDEDIHLLDTQPELARAKAYDVVWNGVELGGGSIRIHQAELQERMFSILGFSKDQAWERFGFLLEAFQYGVPPHGGLAYGLDRMAMLLANRSSIRDVIAFPKIQNASCPLTNAPGSVEEKQLEELHIHTVTESVE